jgi:WD40 repeat protein
MRLEYELVLDEYYIVGSVQKVAGDRLVALIYLGLNDKENTAAMLPCRLLLFDPHTRQVVVQVNAEPGEKHILYTSANGRFIVNGVIGNRDRKSLEVRRADTLDVQARLVSDDMSYLDKVLAVSDDGSMVVFGSKRLYLWDTVADEVTILRDIVTPQEMQRHLRSLSGLGHPTTPEDIYRGTSPYLWSLRFLADSHVFVAVTGKGELSVWDAETKTYKHESSVALRAR